VASPLDLALDGAAFGGEGISLGAASLDQVDLIGERINPDGLQLLAASFLA
jgi:hypothetical protein